MTACTPGAATIAGLGCRVPDRFTTNEPSTDVEIPEAPLQACGKPVVEVDAAVSHQATIRIVEHAVGKRGFPRERAAVNVERCGNTSPGSIRPAPGDAAADGRLQPGKLVPTTGIGAGLSWGYALIERTHPTDGVTQ